MDLITATQAVLQAARIHGMTVDDDDLLEMVTIVESFYIDMGLKIFKAYNEDGEKILEEVGYGIDDYK